MTLLLCFRVLLIGVFWVVLAEIKEREPIRCRKRQWNWPMNWGTWQETLALKESLRYLVSGYILQEPWGRLSFPRMWMAGVQANPTGELGTQSFQGQSSFCLPSCHQQMQKMQWESTTGCRRSFLPLSLVSQTWLWTWGNEVASLCVPDLQMGPGRLKPVTLPPRVPVSPLAVVSSPSGKWGHVNKSRPKALLRRPINLLVMILWFPLHIFLMQGTGSFHRIGQKTPSTIKLMLQQLLRDTSSLFPFSFELCASGTPHSNPPNLVQLGHLGRTLIPGRLWIHTGGPARLRGISEIHESLGDVGQRLKREKSDKETEGGTYSTLFLAVRL